MAHDNPRWGSERIRGGLLKLGLVVSKRIQGYRRRGPVSPSSQTWRTFLTNHAHHLSAADLLTVQTLTFKTLYALVFIAHDRRALVHANVTANPTAAWVWSELIEATPWGHQPRDLLHDRDAAYDHDFRQRARRIGIDAIATPWRVLARTRSRTLPRDAPPRMFGPSDHPRRTASAVGTDRVRRILQPAAAASDTPPRDPVPASR
jgi:hypothetical protein